MNPNITSNPDGGVDITITLSSEEATALGSDIPTFADWTHTALVTLAGLRGLHQNGEGDQSQAGVPGIKWHTVINTLDKQMLPRLEGIRDAAIRTATNSGYSLNDLALALDVPRSTAQYRRQTLTASAANGWERWATNGGPQK